jgi:hypothetical protein
MIGKLKRERPSRREFDDLLRSGRARLTDAANESLSRDGRFDLAYNAAHALSLPRPWRVLAKGHETRNQSEYGGVTAIDPRLLIDLIAAANAVLTAVSSVEPPEAEG